MHAAGMTPDEIQRRILADPSGVHRAAAGRGGSGRERPRLPYRPRADEAVDRTGLGSESGHGDDHVDLTDGRRDPGQGRAPSGAASFTVVRSGPEITVRRTAGSAPFSVVLDGDITSTVEESITLTVR